MKKKRGVIFAAGLVLFVLLAILMVTGNLQWFDDPIREWVYSIRNPALTEVLKVIWATGRRLLCCALYFCYFGKRGCDTACRFPREQFLLRFSTE